ncbi:MAG: PAS domain-containing sensor histidine kinase [Bacteroidetes bacterium]|nr:PAS domain-containing sensor histidine kinase [Bacteroidota bacterium]
MKNQDKTKEQLIIDLKQSEFEILELKKSEQNFKEIVETLNQERELYSDLANALPAGIYRSRVFHDLALSQKKWTSSDEAPYIIEFANDRFFEILDLTRQVFEKNPGIINDLIIEEDKAEFAEKNVAANLNKTPFLWEGRVIINGKIIWIHFESIPRVLENGDIIWTGTLNDISERKNCELSINAKNKELQKLNDEKVKFLSIIAHDLKSPFNAIVGFSELLVEKIKIMDYVQIENFSNIILESSNKALNLLVNLMEWAKSRTGRMESNPEYIEMVALINEIIHLYDDKINQKNITISNQLPNYLIVFTDKQMISTVFRNLISNALKFSHGGEIRISATESENEIDFSISDTGIGIPKNGIEKLFRLDQNYSTLGTNNEIGTGMGLILCKEFIEKEGGKIWVESEVGKGSVFYFTIPGKSKKA